LQLGQGYSHECNENQGKFIQQALTNIYYLRTSNFEECRLR